MPDQSYILITPARNEADFIAETIKSVCNQNIPPKKWIIVNDGSTDATEEIVSTYAGQNNFIQLLNLVHERKRDFGSKVYAFREGYIHLRDIEYDFIGNLDADVSFESDYYQKILEECEKNKKLGIAGGIIKELVDGSYIAQNISLTSVAGAIQLFRRQCYESTGGYMPLKHGGVDAAAEILARMNGWQVRTFPEYPVLHHRRVATGRRSAIGTRFYQGLSNYSLGYHPLFHIMSSMFRIGDSPYLIGSIASIIGFCWAYIRDDKKQLPDRAQKYLRTEQIERLKQTFSNAKKV